MDHYETVQVKLFNEGLEGASPLLLAEGTLTPKDLLEKGKPDILSHNAFFSHLLEDSQL